MSQISRRQFIRYSSLATATSIVAACSSNNPQTTSDSSSSSAKLDKITYGTNWYAQAEHGGFYQAVATGIYSLKKMKEYGIIVSGDAEKNGIGTMSDARWKSFFDEFVKAGVFKPETDYKQAFTRQFLS